MFCDDKQLNLDEIQVQNPCKCNSFVQYENYQRGVTWALFWSSGQVGGKIRLPPETNMVSWRHCYGTTRVEFAALYLLKDR